MKPYYADTLCTIYHGDSREILSSVLVDSMITDPVWPNSKARLFGSEDPSAMLWDVLKVFHGDRVAIQLGCNTDPRFLVSVPETWNFFRVCWLDYACPTRKGRLLYTGDVAYFFGTPPKSKPGLRVISGKWTARNNKEKEWHRSELKHKEFNKNDFTGKHPCPRRIEHVRWLISRWSESSIVDPFMGSGTTLLAAKEHGKKAIGIEIEEKYCEIAARRLSQEVMQL